MQGTTNQNFEQKLQRRMKHSLHQIRNI